MTVQLYWCSDSLKCINNHYEQSRLTTGAQLSSNKDKTQTKVILNTSAKYNSLYTALDT